MKKRNHGRTQGKRAFSIVLREGLIAQLAHIAEIESRTRNGQIEFLLNQAVSEWESQHSHVPIAPAPPSTATAQGGVRPTAAATGRKTAATSSCRSASATGTD